MLRFESTLKPVFVLSNVSCFICYLWYRLVACQNKYKHYPGLILIQSQTPNSLETIQHTKWKRPRTKKDIRTWNNWHSQWQRWGRNDDLLPRHNGNQWGHEERFWWVVIGEGQYSDLPSGIPQNSLGSSLYVMAIESLLPLLT